VLSFFTALSVVGVVACSTTTPPPQTADVKTATTTTTATTVVASPPPREDPATTEDSPDIPPEKDKLLPAGLCSFPNYVSHTTPCDDLPPITHVVLLGEVAESEAAEALLEEYTGKLAPGYPMVLAREELPLDAEAHFGSESSLADTRRFLADMPAPARRGTTLRVVAGLFPSQRSAVKYNQEALHGRGAVRPIAGPPPTMSPTGEDDSTFHRKQHTAVVIVHPAPAYTDADMKRIDAQISASPSPSKEDPEARWKRALSKIQPACTVKPGRVFVTDQEALYQQSRRFAPVECAGKITWVSWAATRLESVVAVEEGAPVIYQVMDVMCDTPFIDDRPYVWGGPLPLDRRQSAGCGRMPS